MHADPHAPAATVIRPSEWHDGTDAGAVGPDRDGQLRLLLRLQTSLDPTRLLEVFAAEGAEAVAFDGASFRNDELGLELCVGRGARHSLNYNLRLNEEFLGQLSFSRRERFSEADALQLEFMTSALVYPLRNALLYQRALLDASRDALTGIGNRRALEASLSREVSMAERHGHGLSLLMMDLDHFKRVNDHHGHVAGDCVLRSFVGRVKGLVRQEDLLFRYGGEEFTLLLRHTDVAGAAQLAERIRDTVERMEVYCDGQVIQTTVSLGLAGYVSGDSAQTMVERADRALYASKLRGRNRVTASR